MSLKIIVLAKQVPDTRNVGPDAMTPEGTVNRAALPAVFNPEDLNALEQALRLKDANPGSTITMLTMGLPKAAEVLKEGLFRGADEGCLLTDRALGGADTLATSYSLAQAIKKIGDYDIILCGRQAIDGDTAQVGPQVAEKLGLTQITYAEEILDCTACNRCYLYRRRERSKVYSRTCIFSVSRRIYGASGSILRIFSDSDEYHLRSAVDGGHAAPSKRKQRKDLGGSSVHSNRCHMFTPFLSCYVSAGTY